AIVQLQIVPHHAHACEHIGTIADECRTFERRTELAILDGIRLTRGEHELAGGDINLAAAEVDSIDAALDGTDDLLRIMRTRPHVSVGHTRQSEMRKGFAPPIPSRPRPHEPRVELVLDVTTQDAVLDQSSALSWCAFIIDVQRAAAP